MACAVPPLLAVRLVFGAKTELVDVPHLIESMSGLLDTSVDVPPLRACKLGSVKLLDRIWNSSDVYAQDSTAVTSETFTLRKFLRADRHYQQYFFTSTLKEAAPSKNLGVVKWISSKFPTFQVSSEIVARACLAGALDILQFFHDNCTQVLEKREKFGVGHPVDWGNLTMSAAILGRRSDIVWWLHRHFPDANYNLEIALESALKVGNVLIAKWLLNQGAEWRRRRRNPTERIDACYVAGQERLDVLHWLDERGQIDSGDVRMLVNAAKGGHLEVVRWLIEHRGSSTAAVADAMLATHAAASKWPLKVAKFLREFTKEAEGSPTSELLDSIEGNMRMAARRGRLGVARWLLEEYGDSVDFFVDDKGHPISV
ncbi:hypothetical protein PHYSODRAFT_332831 [Phytophthora sojae]|uniref:Uncharacterized protein n=1 Tax=Phytophthora sojae (strain P6497) TaxID=1094619 RepID=G4ZQ55_PHYSP|nr:hypothetical protein PHYSODRAFT_332831 [Phytophthora sojae]EGZ14444.1 hypothetical protein PHYSODRAFT_332831 [Phytophthora sojae]|eukprot:XP_009528193.1 hypothetical protein PHYSODRAFT_332831 [Phytophthora sojae]